MKAPLSIRARLILGGLLVLLIFLASAGWAVQQAFADSLRAQRLARLQTTIYLLMAGVELNPAGSLLMPAALAEPRLSLPGSGLYANIANLEQGEEWQSPSTLGLNLPFQRQLATGQWQFDSVTAPVLSNSDHANRYLAASYAVKWSVNERSVPLVFSVLEDRAGFEQELQAFQRTLWTWLGGAGGLLLLAQTLLLRWGLLPLGHMTREIQSIENGRQGRLEGRYPQELAALTQQLNGLIDQQQARQVRYKEALDDLAHSLKTPLAALRATLDTPQELPSMVAEQVRRMNDIVVHQLGRAGASGAVRFAPHLLLAPIAERICTTLVKVYAEKNLSFAQDCPPGLSWRIDSGDAFEMLGNLLDNAAKWAQQRVTLRVWLDAGNLRIRITDDGPGFDDPTVLTKRRVRLDEQVPGHGIGLSVVRDLVASHQGNLTISRPLSGGAQIDLLLPAA